VPAGSCGETRPVNHYLNGVPSDQVSNGMRDDLFMSISPGIDTSVRIGYARVSPRERDHQAQLHALAGVHCREIVVETASSRNARPQLRRTLAMLRADDTLVIYKPDGSPGR
jgi:hypothetical protein